MASAAGPAASGSEIKVRTDNPLPPGGKTDAEWEQRLSDAATPALREFMEERYSVYKMQREAFSALVKGNFEKLEAQATALREENQQSPSGYWLLEDFYQVATFYIRPVYESTAGISASEFDQRLEQYLQTYPDSPSATIMYARLMNSVAEGWRGEFDLEVLPANRLRQYKAYKRDAMSALKEKLAIVSTDPEGCALILELAADIDMDKDEFLDLFDQYSRKFPKYPAIYRAALRYFGPYHKRELDMWERVADTAAVRTQEDSGQIYYALCYQMGRDLLPETMSVTENSGILWNRAKEGFAQLIERFPTQWNIQQFTLYAAGERDYETMARLYHEKFDGPIGNVWEKTTFTWLEMMVKRYERMKETHTKEEIAQWTDEENLDWYALFDYDPALSTDCHSATMRRARNYFEHRNFAALNAFAAELRKEQTRTPGGTWLLPSLYQTFGFTLDRAALACHGESYRSKQTKLAQEFIEQFPDSPTPHLIYAKILRAQGWEIRGEGLARTVAPEDWPVIKKHWNQSADYLKKHKETAAQDPYWYESMLILAGELGWEDKVHDELLEQAIAFEPYYYNFYIRAIRSYTPQWGGTVEDIDRIAKRAAEATAEIDGESLYTRCYWTAQVEDFECPEFFKETKVDYIRFRRGFLDLIERYPSQYNIQKFAGYTACIGDWATCNWLFENKITTPDSDIWFGNEFEVYREKAKNLAPTSFHVIIQEPDLRLAREIALLGQVFDVPSQEGLYPLHLAVLSKQVEIVEALLELDLDRNRKTPEGKTALDLAREKDYPDIVALLENSPSS